MKKFFKYFFLFMLLLIAVYFLFFSKRYPLHTLVHSPAIGDSLDCFNGVVVYSNGVTYADSHGKHYTADSSFYYGKKWQCVEYIKRYYHDYLHFDMTNGMGNAKDFFDIHVQHGALNKTRGLLQFYNGMSEKPKPNDIFVYGGKYGHVAIVSKVSDVEVEVVQQNIYMKPREVFPLFFKNGLYTVGDKKKPNGWLRIPEKP